MTQPNQYEDKELREQVQKLVRDHGTNVRLLTNDPHMTRLQIGFAIDDEDDETRAAIMQLITQKQLEARKEELKLYKEHYGDDYDNYITDRMAELTKQRDNVNE